VLIPSAWLFYRALSADATTLDAPKWIGVAFSLMFFNAAILIISLDAKFNALGEIGWFAYFQASLLISIPLLFALLFNWVAFGPGEREFSGGVTIPFFAFSFGRANAILGRIVFGIVALIMDIFIGVSIVAVIAHALRKD